MCITAAGWHIANHYVQKRATERFYFEGEDARQRILKRMLDYEQVLRGGVALFHTLQRTPAREEWHRYVSSLDIQTYFPGIQGIGVTLMLKPSELQPHIDAIRQEGFSNYTVKPQGKRDNYSAIVYLEPFDWRNRRAFGYDMYSNPMRREAMERARDTGLPSLSGRVTLVQETKDDVQAGFLVYLPIYRKEMPLDTVEQRRQALTGFVYSPFRMNDLMSGILGTDTPNVGFELYDGVSSQDMATLLYDSDPVWDNQQAPAHQIQSQIELPGRTWTARFHSRPAFTEAMSSNQPILIAIGGLVVDLLLFTIIWSLAGERSRVQSKAEAMTVDLRNLSQRLDLAQESAGIGTWDLDLTNNHLLWDVRMFKLYGMSPENFTHNLDCWSSCLHPNDFPRVESEFKRSIATGEKFKSSFRISLGNGEIRVLEAHATLLQDSGGKPVRMVGINSDITERRRNEEKLMLAANVFEHAHEGIMITDENERIIDVNPTFCELTGYSKNEIIGETPRMLQSGRQEKAFYQHMWQEIKTSGFWQGEIWNRRKNGELYAELLSISTIRELGEQSYRYVAIFSDITKLKHQQEKLIRLAHYDALTQLPNRVLLADHLNKAMAQARRSGLVLAVCYLDLDGFKPVNDNYGHDVGDQLLVKVAERLNDHMRASDSVSRLGGDEFVLLLNNLEGVEECDHALQRLMERMTATYHVDDKRILVSASIGVTLFPWDDVDADTLLRHADQAMYRAKENGRNRYQIFDPERDRQVRAHREALNRIEQALQNQEFVLYYQPKVDMRRGKVLGAEALLRWLHPEQGLLPPGKFLPIAEESDFSIQLGEWVLNEALRQLTLWKENGLNTTVSVNISGRHFQKENFAEKLMALLTRYPLVKPSQLELEVLESSALEDIDSVSQVISACRAMGIPVAIDDFGTGYSSLTYLKRLPADTLKIDQSFIRNMLVDIEDLTIVEGIIGLSHAFRRKVIAEGIESEEHGVFC
nr:CHASE domain-containing protein [Methylomarinum sp. Ch1-1]MDP4519445.1 EAL domain-containing protein [Methylomarinum sp. Ch1-1]